MGETKSEVLDMGDVFVRVVLGACRVRQIEGGDAPRVEAGRRSATVVALEELSASALDLSDLRSVVEESFGSNKERMAATSSTSSVRRSIEALDLDGVGALPMDEG